MSLQIGGVLFKTQEYKAIQDVISNKILGVMIKSADWQIRYSDLKQDKWNQIFPIMLRSNVDKIQISMSYSPSIIKHIIHIDFPYLRALNLSINEIVSIEPLVGIKAPILEVLKLSKNRITSIKPLCKMDTKYIVWLELDGNEIHDFYPLTKVKFYKNIQKLMLERWQERPIQAANLNWMLKLNAASIKYVNILYDIEERFKDERRIEMVRQKYKGIQFK